MGGAFPTMDEAQKCLRGFSTGAYGYCSYGIMTVEDAAAPDPVKAPGPIDFGEITRQLSGG